MQPPVFSLSAAHPGRVLSTVWQVTLDLLFPRCCFGCGTTGSYLCAGCSSALETRGPRCSVCWKTGAFDGTCQQCLVRPPAFRAARSAFVFKGAARETVHALKYQGASSAAVEMAEHMAVCLASWSPPVKSLVAVPLSPRRKRVRGFNQSELLARRIAELTDLPFVKNSLVRRTSAPPQARSADEEMRRANVEGAFAPGKERVRGPVLLIDDVLTSGATLDACARSLLQSGAGPVFALTFARD